MICPEYDRLRQLYQTTLTHWGEVMLSPGTNRESLEKWHAAQISQRAIAERMRPMSKCLSTSGLA
jgi:hypothetical protein